MQGLQPTGNRVLLERLDGDGREETLASGIIMPARDQSLRHGNAERVPDTFRARVLAVSEGARKATGGVLVAGDEVLCHTYEQTNQRTLVGDVTPYGLLVDVENILGVYESDERHMPMPITGVMAKAEDFRPEQAIMSMGFHRRGGF